MESNRSVMLVRACCFEITPVLLDAAVISDLDVFTLNRKKGCGSRNCK